LDVEGPLKEGRAVAFGSEQFFELLYLVAELDGKGIRLQLAAV
jgi:hypothetical protein